ncbi:MAG: flagellar biosynthetic protein FliO [Gammaproteobacteria bacterium]|nr:flagellar biosynthetic protein FliO [Gammaproteobacteria bacterium]
MRLLASLLFCLPMELFAQQASTDIAAVDPLSTSYLMKLTGGLLLVVIVIFFIAWLVKRLNLTQHSQNSALKVIAGLPLGTRDRIVVLQVGREQVLLGLSPGRIEKLHTLAEPLSVDDYANPVTPFAEKLNSLMGKSLTGKGVRK